MKIRFYTYFVNLKIGSLIEEDEKNTIVYEREAGKKIVTQREMILFYEADHTLNHFEFHRIAIG